MRKNSLGRITRASRWAAFGAVLLGAFLATAGAALASGPTGPYKVFSDCPYEKAEIKQCIYSETTGGEVIVGSSKANIKTKMLLQGGTTFNVETGEEKFVGAKDGDTLSKAAQPVEGGLLDLLPKSDLPEFLWPLYEAAFENGVSGVNATTELAKPASEIGISASNLVEGEGVALRLPVKVHLENPFLGSECYIGSSSNPIYLNLTTGVTSPAAPNKPIDGFPGDYKFAEKATILEVSGYKLVDNAFSAPAATGCGGLFSFLINPILNEKVKLPAPDGENTAILTGGLERGYAPAVRKSAE
jgi:hypothetical protein